jgi:hypothetical protein
VGKRKAVNGNGNRRIVIVNQSARAAAILTEFLRDVIEIEIEIGIESSVTGFRFR